MRRFFVSLVLLTSFADLAFGQECDKAKLRGLIELPREGHIVDCIWVTREESADPAKQITVENQRLKGTLGDAEIYFKIADCYDHLKDEKKRDAARQKAKDLLKPHLDAADPKKVHLLILYCQNGSFADREEYAPKAVLLAPGNADAWAELGMVHLWKCAHIVRGIKEPGEGDNWDTLAIAKAILKGTMSRLQLDEAENHWNEAHRCLERSRALAPAGIWRATPVYFYSLDMNLPAAFAKARGKEPPTRETMFTEMLAASRRCTELGPDNVVGHSFGMLLEMCNALENSAAKISKGEMWKFAGTPQDKDRVAAYMKRLEQFADKAGPSKTPVSKLTILMALSTMLGGPSDTERLARRILQADPKHHEAADCLWLALCETKRFKEAEEIAQQLWEKHPTVLSAHLQARSLVRNGQVQEAERMLRGAVKQWPDDFQCVLGLSAIIMKASDKAEALDEAAKLLERAEVLIGVGDKAAERFKCCEYFRAVHFALSGDSVFAHLKFLGLQNENPGDDRFPKALSAFKR